MIPYVRQFDFTYGHRDQVSPLIQRVIADNPGPFTFTGTGTYIIGRDMPGAEVAVIDPGPEDEAHLHALLRAVKGRTVSHILVTHTHRDHAPLARPFAEAVGGAPILAAQPPARTTHASAALDEDDDDDFAPDVVLTDGEMIEGDGWMIEALATPGHASNHMAFILRDENALFSGDHVMGWSTTVVAPPDGDMAAYMNSLDRVLARGFSTIWPTHGPAITQVAPFLKAYRDHRLEREAQICARLAAGDATIADMVPALYAAVDQRLWPAASLSVLSHLVKLVKEERVSADPEPTMAARYRLIG
ncbi:MULTISPECIES: MBL fold metallo-hydrolase [unclassified Brevundimonas]|uniref:MBL fold metallo-hydrolase n=1 Tax=unclassified Brevundimonas TaxID=2622653 RepID=UPI000CFD2BB2|nr:MULTISPECIES: MBL fold metallo-hydrolase [unclassified Brevundimonas]PRA30909.1 MBL fold metallo-hydrolase [Brevundimonas sp. MYb27]PQZ82833.1 MBL fold metallo-hydrolase [Brevundimonas sp. MYb31]PRB16771.1 MBL fold metallo-hydrolase [Brevundimonas sp. MYb52]PRB34692.1 MBL fold metallo-hydrolase [Brevundimonas sp. MYb46]PRB54741.1 MBL fold metallo-hydrolase [Brevundimonas sp. MYb33]